MKKSAYLFFGIVLFLLLLPFLTGWVYPEIQNLLHTKDEQVQEITALVEDYMTQKHPDTPAEILRIRYSHHAQHYYVELSDAEGREFYLIIPEQYDGISFDRISDDYCIQFAPYS